MVLLGKVDEQKKQVNARKVELADLVEENRDLDRQISDMKTRVGALQRRIKQVQTQPSPILSKGWLPVSVTLLALGLFQIVSYMT